MTKSMWGHEHHKVFVDLCKEQKMLGNKPVLQHILKPFQQKTGTMLTKIQLKNHWDKIVRQWKIWCRLVQCSHITYEMGSSDKDVWCQYSRLGQLFTGTKNGLCLVLILVVF